MRSFGILWAAAVLCVAGCNSGGGGGGCGVAGQGCVGNSCCAGLQCINGVCGTTAQCSMSGQNCGTGCCAGLSCMNGTCQVVQQCASTGQSCTTAACCTGLTCTAGTCMGVDMRKDFGQAPCTSPNDCKTNLCVGFTSLSSQEFCSIACNKSGDCTGMSTTPYWCVSGTGAGFCLRQCSTSADCADLGSDWSCDVGTDTEGLLHGLCGVFRNLAEGQVCTQGTQCAMGRCNGAWCAAGCFATSDCGQFSSCLLNQGAAQTCFPNCTSNADCAQFNLSGLNTTCKSTTDVGGATVMICAS
jgi:hypothetical protein